MITVKKKYICIEIDGEDVEILSDICEIIRIYLRNHKNEAIPPTYDTKNTLRIENFITKIFEL